MMTGSADNGREDGSGGIVTGKTGLAHTRTIVDNEGSNFLFHGGGLDRLRIYKGQKDERKQERL